MTSVEGFIVVECSFTGTPTGRMWIFNSDVEASKFSRDMHNSTLNVDRMHYSIRRANIVEIR